MSKNAKCKISNKSSTNKKEGGMILALDSHNYNFSLFFLIFLHLKFIFNFSRLDKMYLMSIKS